VADRGAIKLWRTSDGARVKRVDLPPASNSSFEFISQDTIFRAGAFGECTIWDLKHETKRSVELPDRDGYITALAFRQNQRVVLVGGTDTVIMLWNAANHRLEDTIEIHEKISNEAVSRNGDIVVLDEYNSPRLRLWSTSERKEIATYNTERDHPTAIARVVYLLQ
jgi:WD40 repeat protein